MVSGTDRTVEGDGGGDDQVTDGTEGQLAQSIRRLELTWHQRLLAS